jgi:tetratricopeptide (TPR) repeat protein
VHPLNSQVVYSIATLQDVLLFCSGMLALWLLMRYKSGRSIWLAAGCLLLALLSKEAGIIFVVLAALYLVMFDRARLKTFVLSIMLPIGLYLLLKLHAVGFSTAQHAAPIDSIGLVGRLLTLPSLPVFYLAKLLFPAHLATTYYWVNRTFTFQGVLLPLLIDLAVLAAAIYIGLIVRRRLPRLAGNAYWFFAAWVAISLLPYLQLTPLDMTACDTWFYIPMAGLLGMFGVALQLLKLKVNPTWVIVAIVLALSVLGVRSFVRGQDYRSEYAIARANLAVSDDQFTAMTSIAQYLIDHGNYPEAAAYARRSIAVYPVISNYNLLGVALQQHGDYAGAAQAYTHALHYGDSSALYENLSLILTVYGQPVAASQLLHRGLALYPQDFKLWIYLAIFEGSRGSTAEAKTAIQQSVKYGSTPTLLYNSIMADQPFALPILGKTLLIR